jgi:hypothetical protein
MPPPVCSIPDTTVQCAISGSAALIWSRNGVTLACHVFESLAVNDNDPGPTILNDACLFELAGYQSNRRPPYSRHLRKELLGQRKDVAVDPIAGLEQPTG